MLQMRAVTSKCTKLIDAHQNFLDALEGCSASERGRRERSTTITLHRLNSCDSCQEIMLDLDLCGESALSDQRYEHLMATSWEYVREGLLVEDWGCNKAVFSVKHHGTISLFQRSPAASVPRRDVHALTVVEGGGRVVVARTLVCAAQDWKHGLDPQVTD